ncbi:OsmC family protein [Luteococcus peritonei]|uniref:OsmC family protein n=1 Tax=Luteococcus peritonei TaxID=88874 RepID=A0ABW4RXW2_9ACTN
MSRREVRLERTSSGNYRATSPDGVSVEVGQDEGVMSPVELLLAALGACSAIDVDTVMSRRGEPDSFEVLVAGEKVTDETGGVRMSELSVDFRLDYGQGEAGQQAERLVPRLVRASHEKDCTVSRTIELGTPVTMTVDGRPTD